jgi:cytoskeletal protein CcmA (bactofilin family)
MGDAANSDNSQANQRSFSLGAGLRASDGVSQPKVVSVLEQGVTVVGTLKTSSALRIDGQFEGEIEAGGYLELGPNSHVKGKIVGTTIVIMGKFEGVIQASEKLSLAKRSWLKGDVAAQSLAIEEGAVFLGRCSMPQPSA